MLLVRTIDIAAAVCCAAVRLPSGQQLAHAPSPHTHTHVYRYTVYPAAHHIHYKCGCCAAMLLQFFCYIFPIVQRAGIYSSHIIGRLLYIGYIKQKKGAAAACWIYLILQPLKIEQKLMAGGEAPWNM